MIRDVNCFAKFLANRATSLGHALGGLGYALKTEGNMRVHLVTTLLVVALGVGLGITRLEWLAIVLAIALVWVAELLNTALENLSDIVSRDKSIAMKRAKDTAAAAVLAAAICAAVIGALVFAPYFWG